MLSSTAPQTTAASSGSSSILQRSRAQLLELSLRTHLLISAVLRLALIAYGQFHDSKSEVPYTDIDYKVVTDGARHMLAGESPFKRHTYRYSPIMAFIQLPNILVHGVCGKLIYASFDLLVALLIYALVRAELQSQCHKAVQSLLHKFGKTKAQAPPPETTDERNRPEKIARASACFWLYNPLTAVISTRGNGDSFSSFFVIVSIYLLAKAADYSNEKRRSSLWLVFVAGLAHGFAIHLRLYPLIFSLAYYLSLSRRLTQSLRDLLQQIFFPTRQQIVLVLGTLVALLTTTYVFYHLYGWQYIYEAYIYHFVRKDVRHNFSLYFLLQYLSSGGGMDASEATLLEKFLILTPQFLLLIYISFGFGQFRQTLPFCVFALAFVIVTFNSVVTSQYFVWYLALLPLCLNNLQYISLRRGIGLFVLWLVGQALWLLPAYMLEFQTRNVFYWIGAQGAVFFLINCFILMQLIENYSFTYFKINFRKLL